ncbi:LexA family protein [Acinetobacter bereziniae]|uniref:LexA family protein n=1 Tax=Acinetobacter bereziniae TaxID=106648 RepID=UPI003AF8EF22
MKLGLGNAIKTLRMKKKMSQETLGNILEVDKGNVSRYESGKQVPDLNRLEKIANTFDISLSQLFEFAETNEEPNLAPLRKHNLLPVLTWVQAGIMTNVESVNPLDIEEWLPAPEDGCEDCFYLKVKGVSNEPAFREGDYILVDPTVCYEDMQSGDMIVVSKNNDATFKKLVIESDGSKFLQALNPNFTPNIIPIDEECIFKGQVIESARFVYKAKRRTKLS